MHNHTENVLLFYDCLLLNPTSWLFLSTPITIVTDPHLLAFCFCFAMLYMIPYLVIGSAVWYSLRKRAWSVQTMAICLSVNIVILSVILLFVYKTMMPSDNGPKCLSPVVFHHTSGVCCRVVVVCFSNFVFLYTFSPETYTNASER